MPATLPASLLKKPAVIGQERISPRLAAWCFDRSDQINQNSRSIAVSPRGTGQTSSKLSLYDVERSGRGAFAGTKHIQTLLFVQRRTVLGRLINLCSRIGGARRDRTDDILLAKQALSQLSYGPISETCHHAFQQEWWARVDSNYRPHAYQACALTT